MTLYSATASTFRYLSNSLEQLGHPLAYSGWWDPERVTNRLRVVIQHEGVPLIGRTFQAYDETVMYNEANAWLAKQVADLRSWK